MMKMPGIIVGIDGSACSHKALEWAKSVYLANTASATRTSRHWRALVPSTSAIEQAKRTPSGAPRTVSPIAVRW